MTELQKKIAYWGLISFGVFLMLFVIIFNGAYWGTLNNGIRQEGETPLILLSVLIPFLCGCLSFTSSYYFKVFTDQDAINQLDKQLQNGKITIDDYKLGVEAIQKQSAIKKQIKADMRTKQIELKAKQQMEEIQLKEAIKQKLLGAENGNQETQEVKN